MASIDLVNVDAYLATLARWVADPPLAQPVHVVTYVRVARWRGQNLPEPRSAYARALFRLADGDERLAEIIESLDADTASIVLKDAASFTSATLTPILADALEARQLTPGQRFVARLAQISLPRCLVLLHRLQRSNVEAFIESLAAAYLSLRALGPAPRELVTLWNEMLERFPTNEEVRAAQVAVLAIEAPHETPAALASGLEEVGSFAFANVAANIVGAAMKHAHSAMLELAGEGWPQTRALVLEGIAHAEPLAPELGELFDRTVARYRDCGGRIDRTPGGKIELLFPMVRTAIAMRDFERARTAISLLQPSGFMLAAATRNAMRAINLEDEIWRPTIWEQLVGATDGLDDAQVSSLEPTIAAATWKLETLPIASLSDFSETS
ncbi:MAG: hypothetical protein QM831_04270 [Kofleriaceae bacterium]